MTTETKPVKLQIIPESFYGGPEDDAKLHIQYFDRIAVCNSWNEKLKLQYLSITLKGYDTQTGMLLLPLRIRHGQRLQRI